MANGQTAFGTFDRRFLQAPIVEGQPVGTVPGERTLGEPALSNVQPASSPQPAQDDPRKQAQEDARNLADIQGNLGLRIKEIIREAERNPTLARNIIQATGTLIREYEKTRDLRKQVEKTAGISTLRADADSDKILSLVAKIPISLVKVDEAQDVFAVRQPPGETPTAERVIQGPAKTFAPPKPSKPPEFVAIQTRRNQLTAVATKLRREGRTDALKLVENSIKELDAKLRKESTPTEPTSAFFEIRKGKRFLKPSVSDSVRKSAAVLYGGVFDIRTGKMSFLNPEDAPLAVATAAFADNLILTGEETTIANAVQAAGRAFGASFPSLQDNTARDEALRQARESITKGAPAEGVKTRLKEMGIDPNLL